MPTMIGDSTLDAMQMGLRGLTQRRQVAEDAVSNMETPGYIASRVSFEEQLADAIESGDPTSSRPSGGNSSGQALDRRFAS